MGIHTELSMFVAKPSHFFKIILEDSLRQGKLMLPEKFVKRYGKGLSNLALLNVQGKVWPIELMKFNGKFWLQKGWKEFAQYYSVACGHFLVFEYDGNCDFHVLIFNNSATEIDYPLSFNKNTDHLEGSGHGAPLRECKIEKTEDDTSDEILGFSASGQRTRKKPPLPCSQPRKMMRIDLTNETGKSQCSIREVNDSPRVRDGRGMLMTPSKTGATVIMRPFTCNVEAEAVRRASSFKSANPFFKIAMKPSHVRGRCTWTVPKGFAEKYFTKNKGNAILCVSDGRTWPVMYTNYAKHRVLISTGWRLFLEANRLGVGDVCIFELIKITEISMKVVIFRLKDVKWPLSSNKRGANQVEPNEIFVAKTQSDCNSNGTGMCTRDDEHKNEQLGHPKSNFKIGHGLEVDGRFTSIYPFFKVVLRSYYFEHHYMHIPRRFVERCIKPTIENVMLQVANRLWPVKLIRGLSGSILSAGWSRFARENSLQVGDVCTLELINKDVLKVSIFRNGCY